MDEVLKTSNKKEPETEISLKNLIVPFTSLKAVHWIVFIGIVVYFNVLFNGFVWDDFTYMINNPAIHIFNIFSLFGSNNQFNGPGYYRPIPAVYISLLWNLFGTMAFFYHAMQLMLQITCTAFVFFFLKRFFSNTVSFFLSLIFLVHPMQVESVAYISGTQNNLFFLFGMIALLIGMKEKLYRKQLLLMSFFLLVSLLSKETGFLFLLMILFYQLLFKRQYLFVTLGYVIGTTALYLFLRFSYAQDFLTKNATVPIALLPLSERLINIPAIFFYYLQTFFYPAQLSIDQQWVVTSLSFTDFYLPLILDGVFLLLLLVSGIFIYKRIREKISLFIFFVAWYFLGIGLVLQVFPLDATVSDRWMYFPLLGLLGIFGIFFQMISIKKVPMRYITFAVAVICVVLLGIRTMVRNTNFVDQLTLFSHDAAVSRNGFDLENQLAIMYYRANNIPETRKHFQKAVSEMPCFDSASNLANLDKLLGDKQALAKDNAIIAKCKSTHNLFSH